MLYYLDQTEDPVVSVADFADQLCTWEGDWDDRTEQPPASTERIFVLIYTTCIFQSGRTPDWLIMTPGPRPSAVASASPWLKRFKTKRVQIQPCYEVLSCIGATDTILDWRKEGP